MYRKLICKNGHNLTLTKVIRFSKRDGQRYECHACKLISKNNWWKNSRTELNKLKHISRRYAQYAVSTGKLIKFNWCTMCGYEGRTDLHHLSYVNDPSFKNIMEVCKQCHNILDKDIIPFKLKVGIVG